MYSRLGNSLSPSLKWRNLVSKYYILLSEKVSGVKDFCKVYNIYIFYVFFQTSIEIYKTETLVVQPLQIVIFSIDRGVGTQNASLDLL